MGLFDVFFGDPQKKVQQEMEKVIEKEFFQFKDEGMKFWIEQLTKLMGGSDQVIQQCTGLIDVEWIEKEFLLSYCFTFFRTGFCLPFFYSGGYIPEIAQEPYMESIKLLMEYRKEVEQKVTLDFSRLGERSKDVSNCFIETLDKFQRHGEHVGTVKYPLYTVKQKPW